MTKHIGIIGGGIVGATAAYYLTKENQQVTVFDEGTGQATSAAAGIISPWLSQRRNKEWYFLAKEGAKFYQTLMSDLATHGETSHIYQQTGTILYKKTPTLLEKLEKLATTRLEDAPEIGTIQRLSAEETKQKIPAIALEEETLFITGGAKVDGSSLVEALLSEVTNSGNNVLSDKISNISYENSKWQVTSSSTTYSFDTLILACGAWVGDLLRPLDYFVDIRPQKGQLIEVTTDLNTTDWPVIMPVGETDIIPFSDGKILVGATHENEMDFDLIPDNSLLNQLKKDAELIMPSLKTGTVTGVRVGTRAYTSDFSPFFGEIETLPHLYLASGLGSTGLTMGPIIGKTLADWSLNKETDFEIYRHKPNQYIYPNSKLKN